MKSYALIATITTMIVAIAVVVAIGWHPIAGILAVLGLVGVLVWWLIIYPALWVAGRVSEFEDVVDVLQVELALERGETELVE